MAEETLAEVVSNPSHVLFLHPSNNPNNLLVSELMNGENYAHWRKAVKVALMGKNVIPPKFYVLIFVYSSYI